MFVIRRFIFLLACFLLLGKDVTYAYSLSHKLEIQLKQKHLKNGGDFIHPVSINDLIKLLIVENEEIPDGGKSFPRMLVEWEEGALE